MYVAMTRARDALHLVAPLLGAVLLIPAFCAGAGIPAFSFATALSWPLSLAGPVVAAWYLIGVAVMGYLLVKRRSSLQLLADTTVDPEPAPAGPVAKKVRASVRDGGLALEAG